MSNTNFSKTCCKSTINVDINSALTSKTCALIVIEIIKHLSYQRLQIPYTFERLKYVVEKKKERNKDGRVQNESWQSENYFRTVSNALESLETIFKNINTEFSSEILPKEVCILLGSNTLCPREVYRILIPQSLHDHFYENHMNQSLNVVRNVLKYLVCSEDMHSIIYRPLNLTNMHILLKRKPNDNVDPMLESSISEFFLPIDSLKLPNNKIPIITINLNYNPVVPPLNCCKRLKIFDDFEHQMCDINDVLSVDDVFDVDDDKNWFRSNVFLKGFKASYVNGQSVSDLWTK